MGEPKRQKGVTMKTFNYTIKDKLGIHARPAGLLVKEAKNYQSKITLTKGEKTVEATKLMAVMGLGAKQSEAIVVKVEGVDEEEATTALKKFFESQL